MAHSGGVLDWAPGGFGREEVVGWELGGGDYAEAFGEVEVVLCW